MPDGHKKKENVQMNNQKPNDVEITPEFISELERKLKRLGVIDRALPLGTMVEEESSEFVKELCKIRRGKGSPTADLYAELFDVIASSMVMAADRGHDIYSILKRVERKVDRALDRYSKNGEI